MTSNKKLFYILLFVSGLTSCKAQQDILRLSDDSTVFVNSVNWPFASDVLDASSLKKMTQISDYLNRHPDVSLIITMYQRHEPEYSVDYLNRRLKSLEEFFFGRGISKERIKTKGFNVLGEDHPSYFLLIKFQKGG